MRSLPLFGLAWIWLAVPACEGQPAAVVEEPDASVGVQVFVVRDATPKNNEVVAPNGSILRIRFSREVDPVSLADGMTVFGRHSGAMTGAIEVSEKDRLVAKFTPDRAFSAGEQVFVTIARGVRSANGAQLRAFAYQFRTASSPSGLSLTEVQQLTTRSEVGEPTQANGSVGADLNGDGFVDIAVANEITADLRVFLNEADGSGTFGPLLSPTSPLDTQARPTESADFDGDGIVDLAVASPVAGTVSILLGNGDGSFAPQQLVEVGSSPRAIAVLDADGDGDQDVATANFGDDRLAVLLNDGTGTFGEPETFDGGGDGELALCAADVDNDGRVDLVVGAETSEQIIINRANGDGTFTPLDPLPAGGPVSMLATGDLNGDGDTDVAVANRGADSVAILLGNGNGFFEPPDVYTQVGSEPVAVDLGDLDGDGDLDWVVSSLGGEWTLLSNRGNGSFSRDQSVAATQAASWALTIDTDNDGVLELVLTDELEDAIKVLDNQ